MPFDPVATIDVSETLTPVRPTVARLPVRKAVASSGVPSVARARASSAVAAAAEGVETVKITSTEPPSRVSTTAGWRMSSKSASDFTRAFLTSRGANVESSALAVSRIVTTCSPAGPEAVGEKGGGKAVGEDGTGGEGGEGGNLGGGGAGGAEGGVGGNCGMSDGKRGGA